MNLLSTFKQALPSDAPFGNETSLPTYIEPTKAIIGISAVLLGLGDSAFNTQIMGILGHLYKVNFFKKLFFTRSDEIIAKFGPFFQFHS